MLSVIPHRHKSTPLAAVARALPEMPWKNGHGHTRAAVVVASATAGLAVGTAAGAGAVLFTLRDKPAADGGEEQAPDGVKG
jgi:hypothetical protein